MLIAMLVNVAARINDECHYSECYYVVCHYFRCLGVSVIMLSFIMFHLIMKTVIRLMSDVFHLVPCWCHLTASGSAKANGREPKTGLGQVFNFKSGCFDDEYLLIYMNACPQL
jgi:hypothetical protein